MNALLDQMTQSQLRLISGGVLLLLTIALMMYVVQPKYKTYRAASTSLEILEVGALTGQGAEQQLVGLRAEVGELTRELHGDTANMPVNQMEAYIIGRLQNISWRHDVEFLGVEPEDGGLAGEFTELLFNVELRGDYFDLFAWLQSVSGDLGFVVIKRFEMAPVPQQNGDGLLQVNLTMASYRAADA